MNLRKKNNNKKHLAEKKIRFMVSRGGEEDEGEAEENKKGTVSQIQGNKY